MKFTFICESPLFEGTKTKVIHEFEGEMLPEVLNAFEYFLKGASFHFDGGVDIMNDEQNDRPKSKR
jgi:hypothetical protein